MFLKRTSILTNFNWGHWSRDHRKLPQRYLGDVAATVNSARSHVGPSGHNATVLKSV